MTALCSTVVKGRYAFNNVTALFSTVVKGRYAFNSVTVLFSTVLAMPGSTTVV